MTIGATAVATALVLSACGGDDGNSTIEADPDDTTTTTVASDSSTTTTAAGDYDVFATATSLVNVPDELPDGQYFGYITELAVADDGAIGQFDLAELLTGEAARAASGGDGTEPSDDFFIKNDNTKLRPITVASDATINDVDYVDCCDAKPTGYADFIADRDAADEERTAVSILVEDGTVTRIDEIYFP